jgi:hypothetical protein
MKRPGLSGAVMFWVVLLYAVALASTPALASRDDDAAKKPRVDLRQHPTGGKTPVDVEVGLYVTNFVGIDETRESFEVGGYLTAKWKDPRLVLSPDQAARQSGPRAFRVEDLWTPAIESANSISHKTSQYFLTADKDGMVTYVERFDANLSNDFDLRTFPFDTQQLRFQFHPFISAASDIRFAKQALPSTGISPEQHTELAAWRIHGVRYTTEKIAGDRDLPIINGAAFEIGVTRRSGFYVWKIFVPLMLLTMIPMVTFWIDVSQFDWVLKIPMTMLLSMVAFEFTIARDLPRIGYLTFLDTVFLASFTFCFLCIFEILIVFLLQKNGRRALAVTLHRAGKWAYPVGYFGLIFILALGFLG